MATVNQFKRSKGHTHTNSPKPTAWPAVSSFQYLGSSAWQSRRVNERANPRIKDPLLLRRVQSTHCSADIAVRMREVLALSWEAVGIAVGCGHLVPRGRDPFGQK